MQPRQNLGGSSKTETVVVFMSSGEAIPGTGGQQPAAHQRPAPGAEEQPALWGAA